MYYKTSGEWHMARHFFGDLLTLYRTSPYAYRRMKKDLLDSPDREFFIPIIKGVEKKIETGKIQ